MRPLFLFFALLMTVNLSVAQSGKGNKAISKMNFEEAVIYYKRAYLKKPSQQLAEKLAFCYKQLNNPRETEFWLECVLTSSNYHHEFLLHYANALKLNGKYTEARSYYSMYGEQGIAEEEKAKKLAESCTQSMLWNSNPNPVELIPNAAWNKSEMKFFPSEFADKMIYIPGKTAESAIFSNNKDTIYFTVVTQNEKRYNLKRDDLKSTFSKDLMRESNKYELAYSVRVGNQWDRPARMFTDFPKEISFAHPALSPAGNILYFSANLSGGIGGMDIYYCEKDEKGNWGTPKHAGDKINSEGDDIYPFVADDGTLYFSSDGHSGMGGFDIFKSSGSKKNWEEPENMEYPINSSRDDIEFALYSNLKSGYFSSYRENLGNKKVIYEFKEKPGPDKVIIAGITLREDKQPLSGVYIEIKEDGLEKGEAEITFFSDALGRFIATVDRKSDYIITATKRSYLEKQAKIEVIESINDTVQIVFIFEGENIFKNVKGPRKEFKANTIYYDLNEANIREDASVELDKIALIMQDNEDIKVEFSAHTDCRAGVEYNYELSERRAKSAVEYLMKSGVDVSRISAMAYGKTKILNKCTDGIPCSEEDHQQNRRVEIKLIFEQNVPAKYTENEEHNYEPKG
jgi:outer membrane protein OmpA-like peptidoglycan-associated protein